MRNLRFIKEEQMRGTDVDAWKAFLSGLGYDVGRVIGGTFGPKTHAATVAFQKQHGLQGLGIVGPRTLAIAREMGFALPPEGSRPEPSTRPAVAFSEEALRLILQAEGLNQPGKWPGGASGITIGIGYDLGYVTPEQFEADWRDHLRAEDLRRLKRAVGLKGAEAKKMASEFSDIRIRREDAEKVFLEKTLPHYYAETRRAFPGLDSLPPDAQGALVSLVYNRGAAMNDDSPEDRRREMRAIRAAVLRHDLREIARQIRAMKRLWEKSGLDGLLRRREAEAELVESSISAVEV